MNTPEFVMWAVEFCCPIRGFQDGSDPERTERQLRSAREASEAEREGRVFEGIAVRGEEGFRVNEALTVYGGSAAVEAACGSCPANILAHEDRPAWAGCYGLVVCPTAGKRFHAAMDEAVAKNCAAAASISPTTPAWYGMWIGSPVTGERAACAARILEAVREAGVDAATGLGELAAALRVAADRELRVHVAAYPAGTNDSGTFTLSPHCPHCKFTWLTREKQTCSACGYEGFSASLKQRKSRGRRPYFPLAKLLGEVGASEFLSRFAGHSAQRGSQARLESPQR